MTPLWTGNTLQTPTVMLLFQTLRTLSSPVWMLLLAVSLKTDLQETGPVAESTVIDSEKITSPCMS